MAMAAAKIRDEAPRRRTQDIDRYIGARMRDRRIMLGLTQQQLAELIGVTYQQAHKYEKGINRIAGGRLYTIAQALGVEVSYFYDGMGGTAATAQPSPQQRSSWRATSSRCRAASTRRSSAISPARCPIRTGSTIQI
jgi:DNA-binding XRE family transcriptional regulator